MGRAHASKVGTRLGKTELQEIKQTQTKRAILLPAAKRSGLALRDYTSNASPRRNRHLVTRLKAQVDKH